MNADGTINHNILSFEEKMEILKMAGLPTDYAKWTEQEALAAHYAFELGREIKLLRKDESLRKAA